MFKKDITPSSKTKLKSSAQRAVRSTICRTYPLLAPHIELIIPKKSQLDVVKIPEARATLYVLANTPLFFQHMSDAIMPHLALVHRFPDCFPRLRVDRGAIRFVISGASLMVPGFTSPGGRLPDGKASSSGAGAGSAGGSRAAAAANNEDDDEDDDAEPADGCAPGVPSGAGLTTADDKRYHDQPEFEAGVVVIVEAEGKEAACAIGILKMGTKEMKAAKKGIGIENAHYIGDGLWKAKFD